ncbi:histidine kinase 2/3/4 [Vigna unguiculata]|uniref:Histidine kinase 2/3/4 n=1 Tax=Vigna unguiculata TaxID=3917 RepID=A0A4D6LDA7_VIGUN|nr:histidine kinase 2/3/4 [Vigna unguiculata]
MSTSKSLVLALFLLLGLSPLIAAANGGAPPQELWCVAKNNAEDASLQAALDWACGAGGADCGPIQSGGPCYDPSSVQNTASFAFNDYFLKHGMTDDSCNFNNNAAVTSLNPSFGNCKFHSGRWKLKIALDLIGNCQKEKVLLLRIAQTCSNYGKIANITFVRQN